jgi:hypothetical protein
VFRLADARAGFPVNDNVRIGRDPLVPNWGGCEVRVVIASLRKF